MANNTIYGLSDEELKLSITRLAHFSPSSPDESGNLVIDYLILDSLFSNGALFEASPMIIKETIKKNVLLEFEETEIVEAAKRLAQKGSIKIEGSDKWGGNIKLKLSPSIEQDISKKREEANSLETNVTRKWRSYLLEKYKKDDAIVENIDKIVSSLHFYLSKVFIKHGVDSVSVLYPDNKKTEKWIDNIDKSLSQSFPKINDFIDSVAAIEIAEFLKSDDPERKLYLTSLFNSSYYWHLIQVDEKCSNILKSVTKGQKLILDNNIIYNLVGIHGENMLESSHKILKFAKELGYELLVTTKTIDEFQNSLKWQMREYKLRPPVPSELARIAVERLGADNFVTVYLKGLVTRRISIEEFIAETSHVDEMLEGLEIGVTHKFRKDIEESQELLDEMNLLKQACGDYFNEHIIEHDAFHRIYIRKLRKSNKYNFKEAKAWFLTQDTKLPRYARHARHGNAYLPFCITTNQWIQLNRPFLSRTKSPEEYEASMYNLITQPFLRSILPKHPLEDAYQKVLGRLSRFENSSPELASEITADTHFMFSIARFEEIENSLEEVDSKIDNKITEINRKLMRKLESVESENKLSKRKIKTLEEKVDILGKTIQESESTLFARQSDHEHKNQSYKEAIESLSREISSHIDQNTKLRKAIATAKIEKINSKTSLEMKKLTRNGFLSLGFLVLIACVGILEILPSWAYNYPSKLLEWIDGIPSDSKRDFLKVVNVSIIIGSITPLSFFSYNRILNKKFLDEKRTELMRGFTNDDSSNDIV